MIHELLAVGLLHDDTQTVAGGGLALYTQEPKLKDGEVVWEPGTTKSLNEKIVRPSADPFQATGGLKRLSGSLGNAVMKVSAVKPEH
jgi:phosphogluconate dehydratase